MHTALLSITSGVLLRRDASNIVIDTVSLYSDEWPDEKYSLDMPAMSSGVVNENQVFNCHIHILDTSRYIL